MCGQLALMILVGLSGAVLQGGWATPSIRVVAGLLFGLGAVAGVCGAWSLGTYRTIFPKPNQDSRLIRSGIYRLVRHPLYASLMLLSAGWALYRASWPGLLATLVLVLFLDFKARREERWLREQFPDYADYAENVKRFPPWVY